MISPFNGAFHSEPDDERPNPIFPRRFLATSIRIAFVSHKIIASPATQASRNWPELTLRRCVVEWNPGNAEAGVPVVGLGCPRCCVAGLTQAAFGNGVVMDVDVLRFIKSCVERRRIHWTYHINMRLRGRFIPREAILASVDSYEIIEAYATDKYLPSYLVYSEYRGEPIHIQIAVDADGDKVTLVTAYRPDRDKWESDLKTRRKP